MKDSGEGEGGAVFGETLQDLFQGGFFAFAGRRDAAFVGEKEMDVVDVATFGADELNDGIVKGFRDAAAREGDVKRRAIGNGCNEVLGGGSGQRLGGVELDDARGHTLT